MDWLLVNQDPNNIFPPPLDFEKAILFLKNYLLGKDWYVSYPGPAEQITTDIVYNILKTYSKDFRKEIKMENKRWT